MKENDLDKNFFESLGYMNPKLVNGMWCGIFRYMFTVGVCINMDSAGMSGRFCFDNIGDAFLFLEDWDGASYPVVGQDGCTAIKCDLSRINN